MESDKKSMSEAEKEQKKQGDDPSDQQVCSKPFDPENARAKDPDDPCCNGEG